MALCLPKVEQHRKICLVPDCTTDESTSGKTLYPFLVDTNDVKSFLIGVGSPELVNHVPRDGTRVCVQYFLCNDHVGYVEGMRNARVEEEDEEEPDQLSQQLSTLSVSNLDVAEVVEVPEEEKRELTELKAPAKTCRLCGKEKVDVIELFSTPGGEGADGSLVEMLRYLPVRVSEDDHLPKIVCLDCSRVLSTFHELAVTSRATEAQFGNLRDINGVSEEIDANSQPKYASSPKEGKSCAEEEHSEEVEVKLEEQRCSQDTVTDPGGSILSQNALISDDDEPFTTFEGLKQLKNAQKRRLSQSHEDQHPAKVQKLETNFEKWFECTQCPATFADESAANFHRHRHRLKHPVASWCHYCSTEFPKKRILMRHIVDAHKDESPGPREAYKCKLCNQLFSMKSSAIIHVIGDCAPHPIEDYNFEGYVDDVFVRCAYTCDLCFTPFAMLSSLRDHKCRLEKTERKCDVSFFGMWTSFACKFCTKIFIHYNSFVHHAEEHADGRFSCSVCGDTFAAYGDAKRHREGNHHYQIVYRERPGRLYVCFCGMEFDSQRNFVVHEKSHFLTANLYKISLGKTVAQPLSFTFSFDNFVSSFFGSIRKSPERSESN